MKIGTKLTIGLMVIASLVGLVGIFSVNSYNTVQRNSKIVKEVLEFGILLDTSLVKLLALTQTENIEDYLREKSDYEQIRAKFDALSKQLGEEDIKDLLALGFDVESFNKDTDDLAKISNRLIALQKRKLAKIKKFEEKYKQIERDLRKNKIREPLFALQDPALTKDVGFLQYYSKEALFQYKDQEHIDQWVDSIERIKNNPLVTRLPNVVDALNIYERTARDLGQIVLEQKTIEAQEHLMFRKLKGLISLLEENEERIVNNIETKSESLAKHTLLLMSTVVMVAFLVSVFLGLTISRSISKPISALSQTAQIVGGGDLTKRVEAQSKDEIGVLADTFNKMAEDLSKSREKITAVRDYTDNIIKSMLDALIVIDPAGKIKTINQTTSDLLGYTEKQLIGKPVATILGQRKNIFKGRRLKKLIQEGSIQNYEMIYKTKSEEKIPVSFSGSVMRQVNCPQRGKPTRDCPAFKKKGVHCEKIIGIVGIARDMRETRRLIQKEKELAIQATTAKVEHKRVEQLEKAQDASLNIMEDLERQRREREEAYRKLESTQEKLVQAEKLATVGRLAAGVAHEINNPLASILLSVQRISGMIKQQVSPTPDSEVYIRTLERVERATNRCKRIVAGLLAFSRPIKLAFAPTEVNKIVEETLETLEGQIEDQKVMIVKDLADHLPIIMADGLQLNEVFTNLILNACESMSKGGQLRIATRLRKLETEVLSEAMGGADKSVEIEFSDMGEGILEKDLLQIFDPFFSTKEVGKGTGLGLSISYGIIVEHGGIIEVKSKKGKGTTFVVRLPVSE